MNKKILISFTLILLFLIVGFFLVNQPAKIPQKENVENKDYVIKYVTIGGQKIKVDLASTPAEQNQGLSGRTRLNEDEGMLFVFDTPGKHSFWMKDMNFPIDIIWIGGDMKIIYIKKDARPELYPETYGPETQAKYVLELVSGFSEKNNLKEGDVAGFTY